MKPNLHSRSVGFNVPHAAFLALLLVVSAPSGLPAAAQTNAPDLTHSFAAGPSPVGLAFDGANLWVAN